jgi:signal transduction histidine kinase
MFETTVNGLRYQALALLMYTADAQLSSVVGYTVNLEWVQAHYFSDFIRQIQGIIGDPTLGIEIVNSEGRPVATVGPPVSESPTHVRSFPLVFADQALLSDRAQRQRSANWTARVGVASDASRAAASRGAARTLALLGLGAFATIIGLGLSVRAARAAANLATVQSEFVSAVSHEMKTPLSLIRLASDTLANGRYTSPSAIGDYGRLMTAEADHLTRLIDNVLYYARINDTTSEYDFEVVDVAELVQESIDRFRPQLNEHGFEIQMNVPADAALVRADHIMMVHVIDNIVDNAVKYAALGKWLGIRVVSTARSVQVEIADHGEGIPADDLPHVFEKFYRRKGMRHRGAGLGLAIVRGIVEDHLGTVNISSAVGQGTTVVVELPRREA